MYQSSDCFCFTFDAGIYVLTEELL